MTNEVLKTRTQKFFSECLLRIGVLHVFVLFCVCLYEQAICHGALKLDISTLFTTFFLWTSLQFICTSYSILRNKITLHLHVLTTLVQYWYFLRFILHRISIGQCWSIQDAMYQTWIIYISGLKYILGNQIIGQIWCDLFCSDQIHFTIFYVLIIKLHGLIIYLKKQTMNKNQNRANLLQYMIGNTLKSHLFKANVNIYY